MAQFSKKYSEKLSEFLQVIEIAKQILQQSKTVSDERKDLHIKHMEQMKQLAENPQKETANFRSLAYIEEAILTYWMEGYGTDFDAFWSEISTRGLGYKRKNILRDVLQRKRIKNDMELNIVIDSLIPAQQEGKITSDEALALSQYISDFEKKNTGKI